MNLIVPPNALARTEELTSLFLSATVRDMGEYRSKVSEWAQDLNININLQKYWTGAAEPIEQLCERRLASCSGYIGLFGYRYGWHPPDRDKSITHIEFDIAQLIRYRTIEMDE